MQFGTVARSKEAEVALLIDVENVSKNYLEQCYQHATAEGRVSVRRIYGNHASVLDAKNEFVRFAFEPVMLVETRSGKNSADIRLTMDAMDLLHRGNTDTFVIASSDGDFAALARRLRESGCTVVGIGQDASSQHLVQSCDRFHILSKEEPATTQDPTTPVAPTSRVPDRVRKLTKDALQLAAGDEEWVLCAQLGSMMVKLDPSFKVRDHGFSKLSKLLEAMPRTFEIRGGDKDAEVRLLLKD